ncbi:unnamed protein product [Orchesella dallaii]|uniref:EGF-like domain-containing protein n=1 Tax=Orchesella dallaii TaxID=48710 RepID=A0ABP1S5L5_9HEXA
MRDIKKFYLWFVLTIWLAFEVRAQVRATYGEPCSRANRCDSRASLTCNNGTCECIMADVMTFDGTKCAVFAGEKCTFTAVDVQGRGEERSWKEELPCVKNSWCQEGFCTCLPEFFESTNGTCIRKRGFQEDCQFDLACKNEQFLTCNEDKKCDCNSTISTYDVARQLSDGRCNCNSTISQYDPSKNLCVRLAGADCTDFPDCVDYSLCSYGNKCNCISEYFKTSSGTCELKRGYGKPCESFENCMRDLKCGFNGLCECEETQQVYDNSKGKCVGLVNGTCNYERGCISNAECRHNYNRAVCGCKSGYSGTKNGSCLVSHGQQCAKSWTQSCNTEQGTACKQGRCSCKYEDLQSFESNVKKCVSIVLGPCDESIPCVENAHCSNQDETFRQCVCDEGYVPMNGKCLIAFGQPCMYEYNRGGSDYNGNVCDRVAPLKCIDGICQCDYLQDYDNETKICKGLVGSYCLPNGANDYCTPNAICQPMRGGGFPEGMCQCKDGWMSTRAKRCTLEILVLSPFGWEQKQQVDDEEAPERNSGFSNENSN